MSKNVLEGIFSEDDRIRTYDSYNFLYMLENGGLTTMPPLIPLLAYCILLIG